MTRTPSPANRWAEDVIVHLGEIDRDISAVESKWAGVACYLGAPGRRQQGFGRDATGIEAVAAHLVVFNQHCWDAKSSRGSGHR